MSKSLAIEPISQPEQQRSFPGEIDNVPERIRTRAYELYEARRRID